jgi:hypothetical protein
MTDINTLSISGLPLGVTLDKPAINNLGRRSWRTAPTNLAYLLTPVAAPATHLGVTGPSRARIRARRPR